jgi:hypothetical protein
MGGRGIIAEIFRGKILIGKRDKGEKLETTRKKEKR